MRVSVISNFSEFDRPLGGFRSNPKICVSYLQVFLLLGSSSSPQFSGASAANITVLNNVIEFARAHSGLEQPADHGDRGGLFAPVRSYHTLFLLYGLRHTHLFSCRISVFLISAAFFSTGNCSPGLFSFRESLRRPKIHGLGFFVLLVVLRRFGNDGSSQSYQEGFSLLVEHYSTCGPLL